MATTYDAGPKWFTSSVLGRAVQRALSRPVYDVSGIVTGAAVATPSDVTVLTPGKAVAVIATVAGNVVFKLADGSTLTVPVVVGYNQFSFAVTQILSTGTTATATYAVLL